MNNQLLLLFEKHTDTLIEQTKTKKTRNARIQNEQTDTNFFV